jgi:hypothetical protein
MCDDNELKQGQKPLNEGTHWRLLHAAPPLPTKAVAAAAKPEPAAADDGPMKILDEGVLEAGTLSYVVCCTTRSRHGTALPMEWSMGIGDWQAVPAALVESSSVYSKALAQWRERARFFWDGTSSHGLLNHSRACLSLLLGSL